MDTDKASRYARIIRSFTSEELQRLPAFFAEHPTFEQYYAAVTSRFVFAPPSRDLVLSSAHLASALAHEEMLTRKVLEKYARGRKAKSLRRALTTATKATEESFSAFVSEAFFVMACRELSEITLTTQAEKLLASLAGEELLLMAMEPQLRQLLKLDIGVREALRSCIQRTEREYSKLEVTRKRVASFAH